MYRRLDRLESQARDVDRAAVPDRVQHVRGDRERIAVEAVVAGAMHGARAGDQPCGLGEMPHAARMREHRHALAREVSGGARVVEMDVRDEQRLQVARGEPDRRQLRAKALERDRAAALDEHRALRAAHGEGHRGARDSHVHRVEGRDVDRRHGAERTAAGAVRAPAEINRWLYLTKDNSCLS